VVAFTQRSVSLGGEILVLLVVYCGYKQELSLRNGCGSREFATDVHVFTSGAATTLASGPHNFATSYPGSQTCHAPYTKLITFRVASDTSPLSANASLNTTAQHGAPAEDGTSHNR
jgi:hypothetical protein